MRDIVNRKKREATDLEKIFAKHLSDKDLVLKYIQRTNSKNSTVRKQQPNLKNKQKI